MCINTATSGVPLLAGSLDRRSVKMTAARFAKKSESKSQKSNISIQNYDKKLKTRDRRSSSKSGKS